MVWVMLAPTGSHLAHAEDAKAARHNWSEITYPDLPATEVGSPVPGFVLRNGKADGMQFIIYYVFVKVGQKGQGKLPPIEKITIRLHTPDGKASDAKAEGVGMLGGLATVFEYKFRFGWRPNVLEEAWIEVGLPKQTYWVEVPYGFTRNPADPLEPAERRSGPPKLPPTVKPGKADWLVHWFDVRYDGDSVKGAYSVWLVISNPFSPEFDVMLYHDGDRLKLDSPRTEMELMTSPKSSYVGKRTGIQLVNGEMTRRDSFRLDGQYANNKRIWGTVRVKLNGKAFDEIVPSSLFWQLHGETDPGDYFGAVVPRLQKP
jgi:hypothetical protein